MTISGFFMAVRGGLAALLAPLAIMAMLAGCAGQQEALDLADALKTQPPTVKSAITDMKKRHDADVKVQNALYDVAASLKQQIKQEAEVRLDKRYFELLAELNKSETEARAALSDIYNDVLETKVAEEINEVFETPQKKLDEDFRKLQELERGTLTGVQQARLDDARTTFLFNRNLIADARTEIVFAFFSKLGKAYIAKTNEITTVAEDERARLKQEYEKAKTTVPQEIAKQLSKIDIGSKLSFDPAPYDALGSWTDSVKTAGEKLEFYMEFNSIFGRDSVVEIFLAEAVSNFIGRADAAQTSAEDAAAGAEDKPTGGSGVLASLTGMFLDGFDPSAPFQSIRESLPSFFADAVADSTATAKEKAEEIMKDSQQE